EAGNLLLASRHVPSRSGAIICYDGRTVALVESRVAHIFDRDLNLLSEVSLAPELRVRNIAFVDSTLVWHLHRRGGVNSIATGHDAQQEVCSGGSYRLQPEAVYVEAARGHWVPHTIVRKGEVFALANVEV